MMIGQDELYIPEGDIVLGTCLGFAGWSIFLAAFFLYPFPRHVMRWPLLLGGLFMVVRGLFFLFIQSGGLWSVSLIWRTPEISGASFRDF